MSQHTQTTSQTGIMQQLQPSQLVPSLVAGLVAGILTVIFMFSYAALFFYGELAIFLSQGIGYLLAGSVVVCTVMALTSSFQGAIALPQDNPSAISGLVALAVMLAMGEAASPETMFATVIAAIVLSTLTTGILFFLVGRFKLGNLVRFIPYPVVGGFLAGTGWLLCKGSFGVMSGVSPGFAQLGQLFQGKVFMLWFPGLVLGFLLLYVTNKYSHFLVLPGTVLGAIVLFYLVLLISGTSIHEAINQGWLLEPFPSGGLWKPLTPAILTQVDWGVLVGQLGTIATILIISIISVLLNLTALEAAFQKDVDLNRELQLLGITNIVSGLFGSVPGYHYVSLSTLSQRMGARNRLAGIFTAVVAAAALLAGASALSYFPKFVLGGVIMFIGLSFLYDWVYQSWKKLEKVDFAIIVLIIFVIGLVGFLEGIGTGIVIAVILFVLNYSRIKVVKHSLSGATFHSNVDRPATHRRVLHEKGEQNTILKLQGFVFFGTASNLLDKVQERVVNNDLMPLRHLVFDFEQVNGLDSSALHSFVKMKQLAKDQQFTIVYAHLSPTMRKHFEEEQFLDGSAVVSHILPDLDHALEWCENQVLTAENISFDEERHPLQEQLQRSLDDSALVDRLMTYLEKIEIEAGQYLAHEGELSEAMYFLESGLLTVEVALENGEIFRLRTIRPGSPVGIIGLSLKGEHRHSASVKTEESSTLYRLSEEAIQKMKIEDQPVAIAFQDFITHLLAERLLKETKLIEELLEVEE